MRQLRIAGPSGGEEKVDERNFPFEGIESLCAAFDCLQFEGLERLRPFQTYLSRRSNEVFRSFSASLRQAANSVQGLDIHPEGEGTGVTFQRLSSPPHCCIYIPANLL